MATSPGSRLPCRSGRGRRRARNVRSSYASDDAPDALGAAALAQAVQHTRNHQQMHVEHAGSTAQSRREDSTSTCDASSAGSSRASR